MLMKNSNINLNNYFQTFKTVCKCKRSLKTTIFWELLSVITNKNIAGNTLLNDLNFEFF